MAEEVATIIAATTIVTPNEVVEDITGVVAEECPEGAGVARISIVDRRAEEEELVDIEKYCYSLPELTCFFSLIFLQ